MPRTKKQKHSKAVYTTVKELDGTAAEEFMEKKLAAEGKPFSAKIKWVWDEPEAQTVEKPYRDTVTITAARGPVIFDAKVIHTTGPGLLVETRVIGGVEHFTMVHLGNGHTIAMSLEGAQALKTLLDEWVAQRSEWTLVDNFRLAT